MGTQGNPTNLTGQTITQSVDTDLGTAGGTTATGIVEGSSPVSGGETVTVSELVSEC